FARGALQAAYERRSRACTRPPPDRNFGECRIVRFFCYESNHIVFLEMLPLATYALRPFREGAATVCYSVGKLAVYCAETDHPARRKIARRRWGVTGSCVTAAGRPRASSMAEAMAAPTALMPPSPAPLRPSGLSGDGASSRNSTSSAGISRALGIT